MAALMEIKEVAPEAEGLLIKLGALAKQNPEQLKIFVETLNKNLQ
jgi:hydroxyethylthiazole kinase-like sugar kinase family protein